MNRQGPGYEPRPSIAFAVALLLALVSQITVAGPAAAAVTVTRAELSGSGLRLEGTATASRDITVDGTVMGRSDSSGKFRIERTGFTPPDDCTVDVHDGSTTPRTATLSGCTAAAPPPSSTFTIDDRPLPDGNVGTDYANHVTATGGNGTPYRWAIAAGALPAGLGLTDFASASGLISGRPTTAQVSTFTVRATDQAGNSTTRQFTIAINAARPLVITSPGQLPAGTTGASYAVGIFADGGTTPYSWSLTGGALPPGLALQAAPGRIAGTPTTAGTFAFTLRVGDPAGQTATGSFSITISDPTPPQPPPGTPTLVSPAADASVTTPFTITWNAVADPVGITAYNWQVSTSSAFTTTSAVGTVAGNVTQATVNHTADGGHFWRVQAVNGGGAGEYSAPRAVTVSGTTSPPALSGLSVTPADVTGGSPSTGSVFLTLPAPPGGSAVALSSSTPAVASVPTSVTVAAGQTTGTFTVSTQPVTSSFTVVLTAVLGPDTRHAFLSVGPSAPPASDTVAVQRAEYDAGKRRLAVEATSTNSSATLRAFVTSSDALMGTLANQGSGRYRFTFSNVNVNPGSITVKSTLGGSAMRNVTLK